MKIQFEKSILGLFSRWWSSNASQKVSKKLIDEKLYLESPDIQKYYVEKIKTDEIY